MPRGWKDEGSIVEPDNVRKRDAISHTGEHGRMFFGGFVSTVSLIQQHWLHCKNHMAKELWMPLPVTGL